MNSDKPAEIASIHDQNLVFCPSKGKATEGCAVELTESTGGDSELWRMVEVQAKSAYYVTCQAGSDFVFAEENGKLVLQKKKGSSELQMWKLIDCGGSTIKSKVGIKVNNQNIK